MTVLDTTPPGTLDPSTTVRLSGEIDIFTSKALRAQLMDVLDRSQGVLVLDMSGLVFGDVTGLAVLVGVQRRARQMGITLVLNAPSPRLATMLRITGLSKRFLITE
ncbi:STAS domain-containing protein [Nonomuraea sp. NPDC050643]|uniref:STAS domain-containing protein n=1 Tax=Nonomuraea sp. NPDC050643 TaxID=3155660 RepID=UPI0033E0AFA7